MGRSLVNPSVRAMNDVFEPCKTTVPHISENIAGQMVQEGLGARVGLLTSNVAKWWVEAKSYEITGAAILSSVVLFALILGISFGIKFDRSRNDSFFFNGHGFKMVGLALMPGSSNIYVPVYQEKK